MSARRFIEAAIVALLLAQLAACGGNARKSEEAAAALGGDPYLLERPDVPSAAQREFDSAVAAMRQQQWEAAEQQFKALASAYPQLSGPPLNLALLAARAGKDGDSSRDADAERYFQQAIAANGNNLMALNQYAIWLREHGRFSDAEARYKQALARWPDHADSHLNLGILYDLYLDNGAEALAHYQRYLDLVGDAQTPTRGWVVELQRRYHGAAQGAEAQ